MSKFYVTTPIYYVNDKPHIGHAYTTVAADALARFHRIHGETTRFVTGTDENSQKNVQAMEKAHQTHLMTYLDSMSGVWKSTWQELGLTVDDFIRTTEARHVAGVERFWRAVQKNGDLEKRTYEGLYCVGCEGFKVESDLTNGRCPLHPNKDLERISEENWFFRLTNYREDLLALIDRTGDFVMPEARRNEIKSYIEHFMTDVSVSREAKKLSVGIPVPGDADQRIYVWFDALINYLTAVGYGTDEALFARWWPADLHLVGKDIIKFHCALWPAMIMSAAKHDPLLQNPDGTPKLPKQVYAHGFFTIDGQKISKSLGNAIDPRDVANIYGFDAVRYYLLREISFGEDGDFSFVRLRERYTSDLGNTYGNLVNRAIAMSKKYFNGCVPPIVDSSTANDWQPQTDLRGLAEDVVGGYMATRCDVVLDAVWKSLFIANKYVEDTQPFRLIKTDVAATGTILYNLLEACRIYAWLLYPVMPETSRKVWTQLGLNAEQELARGWKEGTRWGGLVSGAALGEPVPLFPRLEQEG